jgi:protein-tyrosine phosphatase
MTNDLFQMSQITDNIYISGVIPLDERGENVRRLNIKYILCCVSPEQVSTIHQKTMMNNPDVTILCLPYNDDLGQDLWAPGKNIKLLKFSPSVEEYNQMIKNMEEYQNMPMIEIAYQFIDRAVRNKENILIHCIVGVSRSPSMVIYYVMKKLNLNYQDAFNFVKSKRSIINPNDAFKQQLQKYNPNLK